MHTPTGNEVMTCNCKVPALVESHDLAGLQKAIEDPNMTCFTYPCHFQPGLNKHMREYIMENQRLVKLLHTKTETKNFYNTS